MLEREVAGAVAIERGAKAFGDHLEAEPLDVLGGHQLRLRNEVGRNAEEKRTTRDDVEIARMRVGRGSEVPRERCVGAEAERIRLRRAWLTGGRRRDVARGCRRRCGCRCG